MAHKVIRRTISGSKIVGVQELEVHGKPKFTIAQMRVSWFICQGQIYKAADCAVVIFKDLAVFHAKSRSADVHKLLLLEELDEHARWYLLCEMKIKLYTSCEAAAKSLTTKSGEQ